MVCRWFIPDYSCQGWQDRRKKIIARDSERCRGCNKGKDSVRLEVHHRCYGKPGPCGHCVLIGVTDEDLTTLCITCHDLITNKRRIDRYALKAPMEVVNIPLPVVVDAPLRIKMIPTIELEVQRSAPGIVIRRTAADILGKE